MIFNQKEINIIQARDFMNEILVSKKTTDILRQMIQKDTIIKSPIGTYVGVESFIALLKIWYRAFPNLVYKENNLYVHNENIIIDWEAEGKHLGEFYSISATGKQVTCQGTTEIVMIDGKIIDYHTKINIQNIISQLIGLPCSPTLDIRNIEIYNLINNILGYQLSCRQIECLSLSTLNTSIKDIARLLSIESNTVKTHLKRAFEIIGISNKKMLMEFIIERQAIEILVRLGLFLRVQIKRNNYFE
ncbi:ester cyclase [Xenorhabdus bovienii]|uniref:ester cyclase n=1 Tax=Xenorhabdus bovienii TaxID=40576 RepID=UPI0023B27189|nr:ester cyclase [Xenorhabdus bovienii]